MICVIMDESTKVQFRRSSETMINHRNGMLMEDWIDGGKNTRFNGSNAAEMAKKSVAVREANRERDRNLQLIYRKYSPSLLKTVKQSLLTA